MKKTLIVISVFVVLGGAIGFWTLKDFDQKLRSEIMTVVSEKTGRSLVINGETETHFSFSPSITITDVKFSNASWAEEPDMVQVDKLTAEVSLFPLLNRQVKVKRFLLNGVRVNLEIGKNGENNWTFLSNKAVDGSEKQEKTEEKQEKKGFDVQVNHVMLENVSAVLVDRQKDEVFNAKLNSLAFQSTDQGVDMMSQWTVQNQDFAISLKAAPLPEKVEKDKTYQIKAQLTNPKMAVNLDVAVSDLFTQNKMDATLRADISDLSVLSRIVGYDLPSVENTLVTAKAVGTLKDLSIPSFEITMGKAETFRAKIDGEIGTFSPFSGKIQTVVNAPNAGQVKGFPVMPKTTLSFNMQIDNGIVLDDFSLNVGQSDLTANLSVQKEPVLFVQGNVYSKKTDLSELLAIPYVLQKRSDTNKRDMAAKREAADRMFSKKPFSLDNMKAININLKTVVEQLIAADGTDLGDLSFSAMMKDGHFTLSNFKMADYAVVHADLNAKQTVELNVDAQLKKMPLSLFFAKRGVTKGVVNGSVNLKAQGNSQAALASSLNGKVFLNVQDVYIDSFQWITLPSFLSFLSPLDQTKPLALSCGVINVPVVNGVLSSDKKIALESSLFDMQVSGNVNMANEQLDLKMNVSPRSKGLLASVFNTVFFGGTLSSPDININTQQTFDRALSLGVAFFMGGRSAAQELIQQDALKNVCAQAMASD